MKKAVFLVFLFVIIICKTYSQKLDWVIKVGSKQFPPGKMIYRVNATSDTSKVITSEIQAAIDECVQNGGGIVTFSPGTYVTGSVFLKSGVQLRIDKGVLILGSQNFDDYPDIDTRIAGIEMKWPAALINVIDVRNAAITGEGIINARGKFCWDKYWAMRKDYDRKGLRWIVDYDAKRVRTLLVQNSSDVTIKGLSFKNAGFWTVQLLYSKNLTVDGVVINNNEDGHGPSTDGIDIDSSSWVLIQNCDIDCNDDNFCLKAGRDWDGLRVNRPTEYVVIRKCLARRGAGLITLGSETSGGIRHVLATDLTARNTDNGLRIKSATTRGGTIEDIYFQNSKLDSVKNVFQFNLNWYPAYSYSELPKGYTLETIPAHWKSMLQKVTPAEKGIPHAKKFYISNITATNSGKAFEAAGLEQSLLSNFVYTNCIFSAVTLGTLEFTKDWKFNNIVYSAVNKPVQVKKPGWIEQEGAVEIINSGTLDQQMKLFEKYFYCLFLLSLVYESSAQSINRKNLVERHTIINNTFDSLSSLSVGNGSFTFTTDITGLQSFPDTYQKGVPLGTQSEWGWHSFIDTANYRFEESLREYNFHGRKVSYSVQLNSPERNRNAANWFRQNPHRLQLGNLGFDIIKKNGKPAGINDITDINQSLNMWTGEIHSQFKVENTPVDVITYCHQEQDVIAVKINSPLIGEDRLQVRLRFPYPTGAWTDVGNNWNIQNIHSSSIVSQKKNYALLQHTLDTTVYYATIQWKGSAEVQEKNKHYFILIPASPTNTFEFTCGFNEEKNAVPVSSFIQTQTNNLYQWSKFWKGGAVVDFSGSTDERAKEVERRVILSQYLTKIQCAGKYPPQETGLTYNSWFGKPHLEMHWWHGVHFALWNRVDILEKQMNWYAKVFAEAKKIAIRQGYKGVRWQKMTDPAGEESPSSVGSFLIWQQPHIITFAELCYRQNKNIATINKYKELVFATADFMASYAYYDPATKRYILGKGVIPAQERFKAEETFNPAYELAYWQWALSTAQQWRLRSGLSRNNEWDDVLAKLSPLPKQNDKYLFTESGTDSYTNPEYRTDHPSVFGAFGMLPGSSMLDTTIMKTTFDWIWVNWTWKDTWGWDFPMTAMTATRLGLPVKAIDALLMPIQTNTYLKNGHNYQDGRLTIYLPGNGGLLTAIALMCAGYDGCKTINPGIPKNGKWKVKWEGLRKIF